MKIKFLRGEEYRTANPLHGRPGQPSYLKKAHAAGEVLDTDDPKFREWLGSVNPGTPEEDLGVLADQYAQRWLRRNAAVPEGEQARRPAVARPAPAGDAPPAAKADANKGR